MNQFMVFDLKIVMKNSYKIIMIMNQRLCQNKITLWEIIKP